MLETQEETKNRHYNYSDIWSTKDIKSTRIMVAMFMHASWENSMNLEKLKTC